MAIEGFDYQNFAETLASQAGELLPKNFNEFEVNYVINTIKNFSTLAGEAIYNDTESNFTADQAMLITQIIAEWSFHKSIDLIRSGILPEYWDSVMQKIAFTIFEIAKQSTLQNLTTDDILQVVEHHVHKAYEEALSELKQNGIINDEIFEKAENQSNIDEMMEQIQKDKQEAARLENLQAEAGAAQQASSQNSKLLKLASVALLLQQVSQDKVTTILNKFQPDDAQTVIQYMQMPDLGQKVDRNIAIQCLKEIRTTLPESRKTNPDKILMRLKKVFAKNDRTKVEIITRKERPNVKRFISMAYDGDYMPMSPKVANIITQYIEENV